jgi:hypothetical protein
MDRITHQSPRQRGYGSTSSLRNDSLKHTRMHERRKGGIEPRSKAHSLWRTVRPDRADRPRLAARTARQGTAACLHPCRGLSGLSRGPSVKANRTSSGTPQTTDRPRGARGPSETSSNQNSKPRRIETKGEQELEEHRTNMCGADRPPGGRGPSARRARTVREARTEQKNARPRRSTPPNHHRISQTVEAVETRVWGLEKRHTRML